MKLSKVFFMSKLQMLHSLGTVSLTALGVFIGFEYIAHGQHIFGSFLVLGQILPCLKIFEFSTHDGFENAVHVISHNSHE